eukprot:COSAG01_NODE_3331_length_6243_cov_5.546061_3_plen_338_part_00
MCAAGFLTRWSVMWVCSGPVTGLAGCVLCAVCRVQVIEELSRRDESGDRKVTANSLIDVFPLHVESERSWLQRNWGTWAFLCRCRWIDEKHQSHFGWHYQPLDEIRDYFGDHVALYFAWMNLYIRWLQPAALMGVLTMIGHANGGIDQNPLTVMYSIFLALWSTLFLESWQRTENTLKFQWGSEGFELSEKPRPQFAGKFERHPLTGVENLVHASVPKRVLKLLLTWLFGTAMIFAVIIGAMNAYLVRALSSSDDAAAAAAGSGGSGGGDGSAAGGAEEAAGLFSEAKLFKYGSSVCSLTLILLASKVYKGVARKLTDWENHRTETEHQVGQPASQR